MTNVIHIKNSTGSTEEVYIGRPGKGQKGLFGNPVIIGKQCYYCHETHSSGGDTLECYEKYLLDRLDKDEVFAEAFWQLKDKILVCFCKPNPCHGDIIKKILDGGK